MTPEEQQSADMAIILEGKIKERLLDIVPHMLSRQVKPLLVELINEQKNQMMFEIATQLGRILQSTQEENRKPLWEVDPLEIEDFKNAIQEQSRP